MADGDWERFPVDPELGNSGSSFDVYNDGFEAFAITSNPFGGGEIKLACKPTNRITSEQIASAVRVVRKMEKGSEGQVDFMAPALIIQEISDKLGKAVADGIEVQILNRI